MKVVVEFDSENDAAKLALLFGVMENPIPRTAEPKGVKSITVPEVGGETPAPKKRRGRPPKKETKEPTGKSLREIVTEKFIALSEQDYEAAAALLEEFGVSRFKELTDEQLAEFNEALEDD